MGKNDNKNIGVNGISVFDKSRFFFFITRKVKIVETYKLSIIQLYKIIEYLQHNCNYLKHFYFI